MTVATQQTRKPGISLHLLGVICGLTAGVWLGACSSVMAGVTIGENSIIAAGVTVRKNVPKDSFVVDEKPRVQSFTGG